MPVARQRKRTRDDRDLEAEKGKKSKGYKGKGKAKEGEPAQGDVAEGSGAASPKAPEQETASATETGNDTPLPMLTVKWRILEVSPCSFHHGSTSRLYVYVAYSCAT